MTGLIALFTFVVYVAVRYVLTEPAKAWADIVSASIAIIAGVFLTLVLIEMVDAR